MAILLLFFYQIHLTASKDWSKLDKTKDVYIKLNFAINTTMAKLLALDIVVYLSSWYFTEVSQANRAVIVAVIAAVLVLINIFGELKPAKVPEYNRNKCVYRLMLAYTAYLLWCGLVMVYAIIVAVL